MASSSRQCHDSQASAELWLALNFRMNPLSNYTRIFNYDLIERKTLLTCQINGPPHAEHRRNAENRFHMNFYCRKENNDNSRLITLFALMVFIHFGSKPSNICDISQILFLDFELSIFFVTLGALWRTNVRLLDIFENLMQ